MYTKATTFSEENPRIIYNHHQSPLPPIFPPTHSKIGHVPTLPSCRRSWRVFFDSCLAMLKFRSAMVCLTPPVTKGAPAERQSKHVEESHEQPPALESFQRKGMWHDHHTPRDKSKLDTSSFHTLHTPTLLVQKLPTSRLPSVLNSTSALLDSTPTTLPGKSVPCPRL